MVGKYIYCIIHEPNSKRVTIEGINGAQTYTINFKDISACVSDTKVKNYDPKREYVLTHTKVLEAIMSEYTILPMKFGTISKSIKRIKELLKQNYLNFKRNLELLKDKIEIGVKVLWESDALAKEIKEFRKLKQEIDMADRVKAQAIQVRVGKEVKSILEQWKHNCIDEIHNSLREISVDSVKNEPVGLKMLLNSSFLVEKEKEKEFENLVYKLDDKYGDKLRFKYVVPCPPYNFVNIKLNWR